MGSLSPCTPPGEHDRHRAAEYLWRPASWSVLSPITTHVGSATPAAPVLVFPANGANPIAVKPTLIWSDPGSVRNFAAAFDVQVATNTTFASGSQNLNNVTSLSWTLATALQFQTPLSKTAAQITERSSAFPGPPVPTLTTRPSRRQARPATSSRWKSRATRKRRRAVEACGSERAIHAARSPPQRRIGITTARAD